MYIIFLGSVRLNLIFYNSKHIAIEKNYGNILEVSDSQTYLTKTV